VVLARKTGAGAIKWPVLVALGLRPDGKKEVIDVRLTASESAAEWERFLGDLIHRGLTGDTLEMICVDGGAGLLAALPTAIRAFRCSVAGHTRFAMSSTRCGLPTSRPSRPICTPS
jgi:transposase-like protein